MLVLDEKGLFLSHCLNEEELQIYIKFELPLYLPKHFIVQTYVDFASDSQTTKNEMLEV